MMPGRVAKQFDDTNARIRPSKCLALGGVSFSRLPDKCKDFIAIIGLSLPYPESSDNFPSIRSKRGGNGFMYGIRAGFAEIVHELGD